jgi:hypothetical protein
MPIDNLQFTFKNRYFWGVEPENAYCNQHTIATSVFKTATVIILYEYVRIALHVGSMWNHLFFSAF